jgi:predicted transcriptional regulator
MTESPRNSVQSWTESMSAHDRIRAVGESLREPESVNWISERADAAWSTTNEELQDLVDQGQLRRVEAGETTRYQPDYTRLLFEEIRTLIEENTREELRNELAAITEEIEAWQATYDVETWEELEQSFADYIEPSANGRSRATRRAAAASGAGRDVHTCPAGRAARTAIHRPGGLRKGEPVSVVLRPRKHRRHEARSGVLVSEANEGQRDAVSRGRGTSSGRGLSGAVAGARCSASPSGDRLLVETLKQLRDVGTTLPAPMGADRRE